ncbi:MAG: hypothetical protein QME79_15095, partial [Bacillota bacterium]|nr:hypothetical protein [Bacillota bacterium]
YVHPLPRYHAKLPPKAASFKCAPHGARLGGESPLGKLAVATPSKPQGEEAARAVRPRGRR